MILNYTHVPYILIQILPPLNPTFFIDSAIKAFFLTPFIKDTQEIDDTGGKRVKLCNKKIMST